MRPSPFFFICLFSSLFLAIFYYTVTNMAGFYVASELGGSSDISVYAMVFFGLGNLFSIPLANPLADRLGPVKLLVYGLLIYTIFSILCGMATTFFLFNVFRFGLGLSSGLFFILCRRLIIAFASPEEAKTYSFAMLLMFAVVPVFGACFGSWLGYENCWRWIFHVNEPVSLFLAAYFWFFYRKSDSAPAAASPFDWTGYVFFTIGMGTLLTAAALSQQLDWYRSPTLVSLTIIGVPSLVFFILWEFLHPAPLLELKLFRSPFFSFAMLNLAVLFSAYFGMIILLSLWLNIYVNYTPWWISLLISTMALAGVIGYLIAKHILSRSDPRLTLAFAILCFAASCYYSTYFDVDIDFYHLAIVRFLAGLGLVLFFLPIFQIATESHSPEKSTHVFTLFQIVRVLASCFGSSLYVILWQRRQVFFHERLGENITVYSQLTKDFFYRSTSIFNLTQEQTPEQLNVFLEKQATSLALNDVFGCMGYILSGLLVLLGISYFIKPRKTQSPLSLQTKGDSPL